MLLSIRLIVAPDRTHPKPWTRSAHPQSAAGCRSEPSWFDIIREAVCAGAGAAWAARRPAARLRWRRAGTLVAPDRTACWRVALPRWGERREVRNERCSDGHGGAREARS